MQFVRFVEVSLHVLIVRADLSRRQWLYEKRFGAGLRSGTELDQTVSAA
jgi:hypothetical protein